MIYQIWNSHFPVSWFWGKQGNEQTLVIMNNTCKWPFWVLDNANFMLFWLKLWGVPFLRPWFLSFFDNLTLWMVNVIHSADLKHCNNYNIQSGTWYYDIMTHFKGCQYLSLTVLGAICWIMSSGTNAAFLHAVTIAHRAPYIVWMSLPGLGEMFLCVFITRKL